MVLIYFLNSYTGHGDLGDGWVVALSVPGFFLLAQFCLGILVALGNLVNNSVFLCLSDDHGQPSSQNSTVEGN